MVGCLVSSGGLKAIYAQFLLTQGGVFTCLCVCFGKNLMVL